MPITTVRGLRHYYRLEGRPGATPVVLIHALGADHALWDAVVPALTQSCQVLRYDIRGHGGTETPRAACTVTDLAGDLLVLTEMLGWTRFGIGGLSIGALTAMQAALAFPRRVSSLVLVSAAPRIAPPPEGWEARAQLVMEQGMQPLAGPMVERMFSPAYRDDPLMHTMRSVFLRTDPRGYAACVAALAAADYSSRLGSIACPTVVVRGVYDVLVPRAAAEALAAGIKGARLAQVNAAHFPPLEDPAGFAQAVLPLLSAAPM
jgi:3-oxoadipate enol-lactonase